MDDFTPIDLYFFLGYVTDIIRIIPTSIHAANATSRNNFDQALTPVPGRVVKSS